MNAKVPMGLPALLFMFNLLPMEQVPKPPDQVYGVLFTDVEMQRVFSDSKTFADCVPKQDPASIVAEYLKVKEAPPAGFSLRKFVMDRFTMPPGAALTDASAADASRTAVSAATACGGTPADALTAGGATPDAAAYHSDKNGSVSAHIEQLWSVLGRASDAAVNGSSLLPLPHPYIVPGGRFHEIYYWDSYFTMLGLQESGRYDMIRNMVDNFAYMLHTYGHIPNGNRTYYLSRSQPPFFCLMLDLLAEKEGSSVYSHYKSALQTEYDYWMDKTAPTKHIVRMPNGSILNRFYDQDAVPRQESFYEDSLLGRDNPGDRLALYRNLRSGAESGWDFSSRWFADGQHLSTIHTTDLVPVDLNGLLYHLELTLARSYQQAGDAGRYKAFTEAAASRKKAINLYCWDPQARWYVDYDLKTGAFSPEKTIAGVSPFFFQIAPAENISAIDVLKKDFLQSGGVLTTLKNSGQQWDAPNGWAPLQWITIKGLENYGQHDLAKDIARRWILLNARVFHQTGKLMEKYNVEDPTLSGGGGEYPSQDGFGWTNGVLLKLMKVYSIIE